VFVPDSARLDAFFHASASVDAEGLGLSDELYELDLRP
jgi:hypothetical protein